MTPELHEALTALYTAARTDEKGEWWSIRRWMDKNGIYHGNVSSYERLIEIVLKHLLKSY